jgi:hypothetical protein
MKTWLTLLLVLVLLISTGCNRKRAKNDIESGVAANPQPPKLLTAPEASAALQARGAEVITSDGKPNSPVARVHMTGPNFGDEDLALLRPFRYLHYLDL